MPTLRAVLFDLDGVLIDSYRLWFHLLNAAAVHFDYPAIAEPQFHETWGQGIEEDIKAFYPGLTIPQLSGYFSSHYAQQLQHLEAIPGAKDALQSVKSIPTNRSSRYLTGCLTNSQGGLARRSLERLEMLTYLDRVLGADEAPASKPDPRGLQKLCRQLGVRPDQVVLVGDSAYDEEAAKGAGAHFLGYKRKTRFYLNDLKGLRSWLEWFEAQS